MSKGHPSRTESQIDIIWTLLLYLGRVFVTIFNSSIFCQLRIISWNSSLLDMLIPRRCREINKLFFPPRCRRGSAESQSHARRKIEAADSYLTWSTEPAAPQSSTDRNKAFAFSFADSSTNRRVRRGISRC